MAARREYRFQDYALFPHMSILDNVAYGLMVKGIGKGAPFSRAGGAGKGGPRLCAHPQTVTALRRTAARVAIARALVNEPRCCCLMSRSARWT